MSTYLLPLFFLSVLSSLENSNKLLNILKNKFFYYFLSLIFILFIGLRFEIGCDWERYELLFDKFSSINFIDLLKFNYINGPHRSDITHTIQELGHVFITLISRNIYVLNLVYAFIFTVPLFYFCSQIKRTYLSLLISYPYYIVVVGMGPIRQAACISVLMLSIIFVSNRKYLPHFFLTIFSLLIHQFSIIFNGLLLINLFTKLRKNLSSKIFIIFLIIIILLLIYSAPSYLVKFYFYLTLPPEIIPPARGALIVWFINFLPALLFLININKFKLKDNLNKIFISFSVFEILLLPLVFYKSVIAYRLLLYIFPSSIYITSYLPDLNFFKVGSKLIVYSIISFSFISLIIWLKFAFHSYCWVPYQNIMFN